MNKEELKLKVLEELTAVEIEELKKDKVAEEAGYLDKTMILVRKVLKHKDFSTVEYVIDKINELSVFDMEISAAMCLTFKCDFKVEPYGIYATPEGKINLTNIKAHNIKYDNLKDFTDQALLSEAQANCTDKISLISPEIATRLEKKHSYEDDLVKRIKEILKDLGYKRSGSYVMFDEEWISIENIAFRLCNIKNKAKANA